MDAKTNSVTRKRHQVSTIRHSDIIPYMDYQIFKETYKRDPDKKLLGKGTYGKVYASGEYAVKIFRQNPQLTDLILELNIYASNAHDCMIRPVAYSVNDGIGYLAMPRGTSIATALADNQISMERVMYDTLAVIEFLNSKGIAHRDIKPGNMVYHENRCKIIDMGLATKCHLHEGEYYCEGIAHTEAYMDPEYYPRQYNNIKFEIYSLGASYMRILLGDSIEFGDFYLFDTNEENVSWFTNQAQLFWNARPDIHTLMDEAEIKLKPIIKQQLSAKGHVFRGHVGTSFREEAMTSLCEDAGTIKKLMRWLVTAAYNKSYSAETLFLCLHLIHRTYLPVMSEYPKNNINVLLFGSAAMSLALTVTRNTYTIQYWQSLSRDSDPDYETNFTHMLVDILSAAGGIISTLTYWDYATSKEDLLPLLHDIIACDYNPDIIRSYDHTHVTDKCVNVPSFMFKEDIKHVGEANYTVSAKSIISSIKPCVLDIESDVDEIEVVWSEKNRKVQSYASLIGVVLHNRDVLDELNLDTALFIFSYLFQPGGINPLKDFILDIICHFDWRTRGSQVIDLGLHPFIISKDYKFPKLEDEEGEILEDNEDDTKEEDNVLEDNEDDTKEEDNILEDNDTPEEDNILEDNEDAIEEDEDEMVLPSNTVPSTSSTSVQDHILTVPQSQRNSVRGTNANSSHKRISSTRDTSAQKASLKQTQNTSRGKSTQHTQSSHRRTTSTLV